MGELTPKQEKFCREVVKGKSYSQAYRTAYNTATTREATVWNNAYILRSKSEVAARIEELKQQITDRLLMTRAEWLEKLDRMASADVRKIFNPQGDVRPIEELGDAEADCIEAVEVVENFAKVGDRAEHVGYTKKIKLASKRQIMKDYGQARGWLEQDAQSTGPQRIFIRQWVNKEEAHVHLHQHNTAIISNGEPGAGVLQVQPGAVPAGTDDGAEGDIENPSGGAGESDAVLLSSPELPAIYTDAQPVPRRVVRRKILPDLHDAERHEPDDL